jgi:hypothetical protein
MPLTARLLILLLRKIDASDKEAREEARKKHPELVQQREQTQQSQLQSLREKVQNQ